MNIHRTLVVAAMLALSACHPSAPEAGPLAGARIGGPFALVDQDGRRVTEAAFAGRYRIMYFGYTYCPDVCPTDVQAIMQGYAAFARDHPALAARVQPIFVSVDPARDTPPVLRRFVRAFSPKLVGLTGSTEAIARMAKEYGVYYRLADAKPGAAGYLVDHSRQAILFGTDGGPIALLAQDKGGQAVADDLARWVK